MSPEKDRRKFVSIGNILTILAMLGSLVAGGWTLASEQERVKARIDRLEEQNKNTREELKTTAHEIKVDVKEVKTNVDLILRKLDSMEAVRASERRAERDRR